MGDRKALVVGIDDYLDCPLHGCCNDAEAVKDLLSNHENGDPNFQVWKKKNVATKGELKDSIQKCFSGDADVALFYFSGHGFMDSVGGYLVTPDYQNNDWGVSLQEVMTIANDSKCKERIIILDSCHSGFAGSINSSGQNTAVIQQGVTIMTASLGDQAAMEAGGQGVFTSLLIEALKGGAADVTGNISIAGIYAYIDKALGAWNQRPMFKSNVARFTSLRNVVPRVEKDVLRHITSYFENEDSKYQLDPSYEWTNSPSVKHEIITPYSKDENTKVFKELQKLVRVGLVTPVDEDDMYFAAMNSKSCKLTAVGKEYWNLVKENRI